MYTNRLNDLSIGKENLADVVGAPAKITVTTIVNGQHHVEEYDATDGFIVFVKESDGQNFRGTCDSHFMANSLIILMKELRADDPKTLFDALCHFHQASKP